ncbi:MAG TPA: DedA family protein [Thermoleophilaceae bacterium]|nr:DedA family protein [Thermoleophilaceae bacterium]
MTTLGAIIAHGQLEQWLKDYGYLAVFLLVGLESIGVPLPGETMLIAASLYAGTTHNLSPVLIVAVAAAGAIVGDNIGYSVGRTGGWRLLRRHGHRVGIDQRRLKLGRYLFLRHGGKVVFFGRFVSILRTYAALLAGANHMPFPRFFAFNASGGIIWAAIYGFGYYYAAHVLKQLNTPFTVAAVVLAAAAFVGGFIFIRRNIDEWEERAERALPGPLQ